MFILPIRTSIRPWRTPYANYALIVVNVIIFLLTYLPRINTSTGELVQILRPLAQHFMLTPGRWHFWQFISYAFLHGGLLHLRQYVFSVPVWQQR
jgi:membrane associated rhomboid family serine protease